MRRVRRRTVAVRRVQSEDGGRETSPVGGRWSSDESSQRTVVVRRVQWEDGGRETSPAGGRWS